MSRRGKYYSASDSFVKCPKCDQQTDAKHLLGHFTAIKQLTSVQDLRFQQNVVLESCIKILKGDLER
jgi:ABC-type transport system involved in cytochrome c biogenesis ATPase subunit